MFFRRWSKSHQPSTFVLLAHTHCEHLMHRFLSHFWAEFKTKFLPQSFIQSWFPQYSFNLTLSSSIFSSSCSLIFFVPRRHFHINKILHPRLHPWVFITQIKVNHYLFFLFTYFPSHCLFGNLKDSFFFQNSRPSYLWKWYITKI